MPARRAGDPGLNPGPGENFFLKLLNESILNPNSIIKYHMIGIEKQIQLNVILLPTDMLVTCSFFSLLIEL